MSLAGFLALAFCVSPTPRVPYVLAMLAMFAFSSFYQRSPARTAGKAPFAILLALLFLSGGGALWAFLARPFLWSHGCYVTIPGIVALGLCGVLYSLSAIPLRRGGAPRQSWLFLGVTIACLAQIVAVAIVKPALIPAANAANQESRADAARPAKGPVRFAILGDTGHRPDNLKTVVAQLLKTAADRPLSAVILLGDNISGDRLPFAEVFQKRFLAPFGPLLDKSVPFLGVLGNHDTNVEAWANEEMKSPVLGMKGRRYYSVTFGNGLVTAFFLCSEDFWNYPDQVAWFSRELAACRSTWKIVLIHRPLWGAWGDDKADWPIPETLNRLIRTNGVDMVFSGHNHIYERRALKNDTQYITIGNGSNLTSRKPSPNPQYAKVYGERRCFALMEADAGRILFKCVNDRGAVIDSILLRKEGPSRSLRVIELPKDTPPAPAR